MSEKRNELKKQRYSITEKQLQGLVNHEHRTTRNCLAIAIRRQNKVEKEMVKCKLCNKEMDGYYIYKKSFHGVCSDCHSKFGKKETRKMVE